MGPGSWGSESGIKGVNLAHMFINSNKHQLFSPTWIYNNQFVKNWPVIGDTLTKNGGVLWCYCRRRVPPTFQQGVVRNEVGGGLFYDSKWDIKYPCYRLFLKENLEYLVDLLLFPSMKIRYHSFVNSFRNIEKSHATKRKYREAQKVKAKADALVRNCFLVLVILIVIYETCYSYFNNLQFIYFFLNSYI